MTPFEFVEFQFKICDKWKVSMVMWQKAPVESMMMPYLNEVNEKRRTSVPPLKPYSITPYHLAGASQNKEARIQALQLPFEAGEVYFNEDEGTHTEAIESLITQLQEGDISRNDDLKDALSMLNDPAASTKPKAPKAPEAPQQSQYIVTSDQLLKEYAEANQALVREAFRRGKLGH